MAARIDDLMVLGQNISKTDLAKYLRDREAVLPRDFGGLGDGAANDRAAIQACFDRAAADGKLAEHAMRTLGPYLSGAGTAWTADAPLPGGDMADFEPNFAIAVLSSPGYVVANLGGSVRITKTLEAYARVTNLADRSYEDALGYPAPGRLAMVGVRVAISR